MMLTPRGILSLTHWRSRIRYVLTGSFRSRFFVDHQGILLYQAVPSRVIQEVECSTGLRVSSVLSRSGLQVSRAVLTVLSQWPYYLFTKEPWRNEKPDT